MKNNSKTTTQRPFDEATMLRLIYQKADQQGLRSGWAKAPQENAVKKHRVLWIGLALISVFALILFNPLGSLTPDKSKTVAAIISIDINPSFELSVNDTGIVLKIDALNADAKSLSIQDLIGLPSEEAIDKIVGRAETAGFIDTSDLEDDYVLVSTVLMEKTKAELGDTLQTRLQDRIRLSDSLQCINLVQIKATLQEQFQAREKEIPIGLYVINATIQNQNGEILTVKEFFSSEENRNAIKNRAKINKVTNDKVRERVETALAQLEDKGIDTTEIRTRLENAGDSEMQQIQNEVKNQVNQQGNPDNGNGEPNQEGSGSQSGSTEGSGSQSGQPSDAGNGGSGGPMH